MANGIQFELDGNRPESELGLPFLAYMLNATQDEVRTRLRSGTSLASAQEGALAEVAGALAQLQQLHLLPEDENSGYSVLANLLLAYQDAHKTTSVNALRARAGGELPAPTKAEGTPDRCLEQLARDCYPAVLLPPARPELRIPGRFDYLTPVTHRHPEREVFEQLVMEDEKLANLFPDHSDDAGHTGLYYTNLGHGGSIQLWTLAEGLISAAYSALSLGGTTTHDLVVEQSATNLVNLRKLVGGKPVRSKARLGIAGIQLQGAEHFDTPWGVLRPTTVEEKNRIGMGPATPTDAVLEVPVIIRLFLGSGVPPEGETGPGDLGKVSVDLHKDLEERWSKLALSIFLGTEQQPSIAGSHSWTIFDEVFTGVSGMSFSSLPWGGSWAISPDQLTAIEAWTGLIEKNYHRSLEVARDRIIKAVAHSQHPADGLIDAVIALENLFGTSSAQGELIFRISTGCAWLLEDSPDKRKTLRKEVREIYDERSKIVHGNSPGADAWKRKDQAVALVRRSFHILLKERPELISNRDRSSELSLGA